MHGVGEEMSLFLLYAVVIVIEVAFASKGKNLKQRARLNWLGTKAILCMASAFLVAILFIGSFLYVVEILKETNKYTPPIHATLTFLGICTALFGAILYFEKLSGYTAEIKKIRDGPR